MRFALTVLSTTAFLACVAVTVYLPPALRWISGRDFTPSPVMVMALLFLTAATLRAGLRVGLTEFAAVILIIATITLLIISHFTGFTGREFLDEDNLRNLAEVTYATTLPWAVGAGVGSVILFFRNRRKRRT